MEKFKKGDIVARRSHNQDILFSIENILKSSSGIQIAILKGITIRIVADAYIDDLVLLDTKKIDASLRSLEFRIEDRINNLLKKRREKVKDKDRSFEDIKAGRILHLDGDKFYSEKSARYYKKVGLSAVVINIPENKQHLLVREYINKYNPDILVLTGHDRYDKSRNKVRRYI